MEVNYEGNNYSFPDDVSDTEVLEFFQGQSVDDSTVVTRAYQPSQDASATFQPTESTAPEKPAEPEFLSRIDRPEDFPVIENEDGSVSTHKMSWAEVEGKFIAYPTIQMGTGGELVEWDVENNPEDEVKALNAALAQNNFLTFKTAEDADEYTKTYKRGTPMEDTNMYDKYLSQLSKVESGGRTDAKASTSSALGEFQFIDSTWLDLVKRKAAMDVTGKSDEEILAMRTDKDFSRRMALEFTRENEAVLAKNDIEVDPTTLYLAHFLGAGKAVEVLKADPNADITDHIGWSTRMANRAVFSNMDTVEDLWRWAADKMGRELPEQPTQQPVATPQQQIEQPAPQPTQKTGEMLIDGSADAPLHQRYFKGAFGGTDKTVGVVTEKDWSEDTTKFAKNIAKYVIPRRDATKSGAGAGGVKLKYADYPATQKGSRIEDLVGLMGVEKQLAAFEREGGLSAVINSRDPVIQLGLSLGNATLYHHKGDIVIYDGYGFNSSKLNPKSAYSYLRKIVGFVDDVLDEKFGLDIVHNFPSLINLGSAQEVFGKDAAKIIKDRGIKEIPAERIDYIKRAEQKAQGKNLPTPPVESPQPEEEEVQVDGA